MKTPLANLLSHLGWEDLPKKKREPAVVGEVPVEEKIVVEDQEEELPEGPVDLDTLMEGGPKLRKRIKREVM